MHCPVCKGASASRTMMRGIYTLYRCSQCTFVFVFPLPADIAAIYSKEYFHGDGVLRQQFGYADYEQDKAAMHDVFVALLKKFEKHTSGRRVFDVGAATGYFLDIARSRGWKTGGIEISSFAGGQAHAKGHDVSVGRFDVPFADGHSLKGYDVLTMWDVLEHMGDPRMAIKNSHELLLPQGLLAINTVNIYSFVARMMGKRWHLMVPPEHVSFFSPESLRRLLSENGFRVVHMGTLPKKFTLSYICMILSHHFLQKCFIRFARAFDTPFWRRVALPLNLHDNIFVLAEKI